MLNLKKEHFTTKDVLEAVGISRLTLYRWLASGKIQEVPKDYKHHRIFSKKDIEKIKKFKAHEERPKTKKKKRETTWSQKFLSLPGTWLDDRTAQEIIDDVYTLRISKGCL